MSIHLTESPVQLAKYLYLKKMFPKRNRQKWNTNFAVRDFFICAMLFRDDETKVKNSVKTVSMCTLFLTC